MLELTGFKDKAHLICSELSYGDQRILEMGIALSTEPDLLLLDEPTAGLNSQESMASGQEDEKYAFRTNHHLGGT